MEQSAIRVVVVDDHLIVREGLTSILNRQPGIIVAATADDGQEAVEKYFDLSPDVVLMDLNLPIMDGWASMAAIRARDPNARIVAISSFGGDQDIQRALRSGASGYLLKDSDAEEIVAAVRAVNRGLRYVSPEPAAALAAGIAYEPLSARECQVLELVARGHSNKEIGAALTLSDSTVKWHITAILSKLRVDDRTAAVTLAIERGILHL